MGYIKTSVGKEEVELDVEEIPVVEMIDRMRAISKEHERAGFNQYNTLVMVEDGEAFVPATRDRMVRAGERVVLIPFSHGG